MHFLSAMPGWLQAGFWGFVAGAALLFGAAAAISSRCRSA
jgi:hypothetical protein